GLLQGQIGEGEGGDEACRGGDGEGLDVDGGGKVDAHGAADDGQDGEGRSPADEQANADADGGEGGDLGEEVDEDAGAGGAHGAQDGDDAGALGYIGLHAGPDRNAADEQRAEADNDEE